MLQGGLCTIEVMKIQTGVILCGGLGTRMKGAYPMPKSLIPVAGQPTLLRQVRFLEALGVLPQQIYLAAGNGERYDAFDQYVHENNLNVTLIHEEEQLGTGGAIRNVMEVSGINSEGMVVLNGDIVCDFGALVPVIQELDWSAGRDCMMLGYYLDDASACGLLVERADGSVEFREKVPESSGWINAGVYVFGCQGLPFPEQKKCSIEYDVFPKLQIGMIPYTGHWYNLTNAEVVAEANENLGG